jgi:hypothetical protein
MERCQNRNRVNSRAPHCQCVTWGVFGWLQADTVAAVWTAAAAIHREKNTVEVAAAAAAGLQPQQAAANKLLVPLLPRGTAVGQCDADSMAAAFAYYYVAISLQIRKHLGSSCQIVTANPLALGGGGDRWIRERRRLHVPIQERRQSLERSLGN